MKIILAVIAGGVLFCVQPAKADQVSIDLSISCTTPGTGANGERHDCTTDQSRQSAPESYVIAENSINIDVKGRGSYYECYHHFTDYVEVIPGSGLTQPKTILFSAKAMGPEGHGTGSGDVRCHITGFYTKYK